MLSDVFKKSKGVDLFHGILGQEKVKKQIISALIMKRHIILVGPPGTGKNSLDKRIAKLLPTLEIEDKISGKKRKLSGEERFIRIQGSPDLTVEDILGDIDPVKALKFGALSIEAFTQGKIFKANKGVLFFDELNRAPEKLQNALLQVLEEGKCTIGSYDVDFDTDFIFIGTMNPEDYSGTEKLSEVLLDRFDLINIHYPHRIETEIQIVNENSEHLKEVNFPRELLNTVIEFIHDLRKSKDLEKFPSVRASMGLYERAQANAFLNHRKDVIMDDVMEAYFSVLAHRMKLKPSVRYLMNTETFINKQFKDFLEAKGLKSDLPQI